MVEFSELRNKTIYDKDGKDIGILKDLVFMDGKEYAEISHIIYLSDDKYRKKVSFRLIRELKTEDKGLAIYLNEAIKDIDPVLEQGTEFLVGDLIDKQIVDVHGMKVVRVNEVILGKVTGKFVIVAVGVGTSSLMKRLGMKAVAQRIGKPKEKLIPWHSVEPLEPGLHRIHITFQKDKIADLHPSDIADIMEDLSHEERVLIFNSLDKDKAAKTFIEAEPKVQSSFFKNLKVNRIIEILETISPNHAADILSMMPKFRSEELLRSMDSQYSKKIKEILKYPEESAGALMHTKFIAVPRNYTAQQTIDKLRKIKPSSEESYHIYIVDKKGRLLGVLSIRSLITASPKTFVSKLMKKEVVKVPLDSEKDDMANAIAKYNLFALPVVDDKEVLKGVVKADDVLTEVMPDSWKKRVYMIKKEKQDEK